MDFKIINLKSTFGDIVSQVLTIDLTNRLKISSVATWRAIWSMLTWKRMYSKKATPILVLDFFQANLFYFILKMSTLKGVQA